MVRADMLEEAAGLLEFVIGAPVRADNADSQADLVTDDADRLHEIAVVRNYHGGLEKAPVCVLLKF